MPSIADLGNRLSKMERTPTIVSNATIGGTLDVTGATTIAGAVTTDVLQVAEHGGGAIGTALAPKTYRRTENGIIIKTIKLDITGYVVKGTQAKDSIGKPSGTLPSYIGRYVTATDGICFRIEMSCIEVPGQGTATITQDIDLGADGDGAMYQNDAAAIDDIIVDTASLVAGETVINNAPALTADDYIYLIEGDTAATTGIYNAGQFIIRFYGHPILA